MKELKILLGNFKESLGNSRGSLIKKTHQFQELFGGSFYRRPNSFGYFIRFGIDDETKQIFLGTNYFNCESEFYDALEGKSSSLPLRSFFLKLAAKLNNSF